MDSTVNSSRQAGQWHRSSLLLLIGLNLAAAVSMFFVPFVPRPCLVAATAGVMGGLLAVFFPRDPDSLSLFRSQMPLIVAGNFFLPHQGEGEVAWLCHAVQLTAIWYLMVCLVGCLFRR